MFMLDVIIVEGFGLEAHLTVATVVLAAAVVVDKFAVIEVLGF